MNEYASTEADLQFKTKRQSICKTYSRIITTLKVIHEQETPVGFRPDGLLSPE